MASLGAERSFGVASLYAILESPDSLPNSATFGARETRTFGGIFIVVVGVAGRILIDARGEREEPLIPVGVDVVSMLADEFDDALLCEWR